MHREVFRDYLLEREAMAGEAQTAKPETIDLSEEEEKTLVAGWYADDRLTRKAILELERELLDEDQDDGDMEESEESEDAPPEDEEDSGTGLRIRGWSFPQNIRELEQDFVDDYRSYALTNDPEIAHWLEQEMIRLLGEMCTYKIYLRIRYHFAYTWGEEERIADDGHVSAIEILRKKKARQEFIEKSADILRYFRMIYLNKTRDYFRYWKQMAGKMLPIPTDTEIQTHSERNKEFVKNSQAFVCRERKSKKYHAQVHKILMYYFRELMDYDKEPPKALAVMYARVLYQMEPLLDPEGIVEAIEAVMRKKNWSLDPDSIKYEQHWASARDEVENRPAGASPAWAVTRMGSRTIEELENDSELSMRRNFDTALAWGTSMRGKLNERPKDCVSACWRDMVYTECFSKGDIQGWADSVHDSTLKKTAKKLSMDEECRAYADSVLTMTHPLMREFAERMGKKEKKRKEASR